MTIEACVASVNAAVAAERGGADRLELNMALELDGLTPSLGLFKRVRAACNLPIIVMIRPRGNGFVYSDTEFAVMLDDIEVLMAAGAEGIATGFLTSGFEVDAVRTKQVVELVGPKSCVFHRAFDITPSMTDALEVLVDCGVQRILTSGQAPTALDGSKQIKALIAEADGRIEILPGAGIKPANVARLITETGCTQVHGTFSAPAVPFPPLQGLDVLRSPAAPGTDASVVAEVRRILND